MAARNPGDAIRDVFSGRRLGPPVDEYIHRTTKEQEMDSACSITSKRFLKHTPASVL